MKLARYIGQSLVVMSTLTAPQTLLGAEPMAIVTDLQGGAVSGSGGRLAILAELGAGVELRLDSGAKASVAHFASGRQFDLDGPGAFRLTASGVESTSGGRVTARAPLGAAYRDVRLRPARVAQASISMRGNAEGAALQLLSPAGTWLVENRATFRWAPLAGDGSYRFQLTDNLGNVLYETVTTGHSVTLPESIALQAGRIYAWQVNAKLPDGRVAEGWTEFGIADADRRARAYSARPAAGAAFGDRVLYALLLDDAGLREAARAVWDELARERPDDPRLRTLSEVR